MYINGVKYACSTCIKGHRSSHCSHVDRPLFEIRKKGRPVTQCSYCRDLRKTKQVHVKCACIDKKGDQQPIIIYRNQQQQLQVQQQGCTQTEACKDQCICSPPPLPKPSSLEQPNLSPNVAQNTLTAESTLLAPLCETSSVENSSYSWALITSSPHFPSDLSVASCSTTSDFTVTSSPLITTTKPTTTTTKTKPTTTIPTTHTPPSSSSSDYSSSSSSEEENSGIHFGFTLHKSSSQRFLDGQPRERRRRSTNQKNRHINSCSSSSCPRLVTQTATTAAPSLPTTDSGSSVYLGLTTPPPASISPPLDAEAMDFQFDYVSEQLNAFLTSPQQTDDLVNTEELTAILNEVLQSGIPPDAFTTALPEVAKSECGSFSSRCCQRNGPTESVVITITPLTEPPFDKDRSTTRIVSCQCGMACKCEGCFVHCNNPALFQNDPYTMASSNASSCYGSDDELNTYAFQTRF